MLNERSGLRDLERWARAHELGHRGAQHDRGRGVAGADRASRAEHQHAVSEHVDDGLLVLALPHHGAVGGGVDQSGGTLRGQQAQHVLRLVGDLGRWALQQDCQPAQQLRAEAGHRDRRAADRGGQHRRLIGAREQHLPRADRRETRPPEGDPHPEVAGGQAHRRRDDDVRAVDGPERRGGRVEDLRRRVDEPPADGLDVQICAEITGQGGQPLHDADAGGQLLAALVEPAHGVGQDLPHQDADRDRDGHAADRVGRGMGLCQKGPDVGGRRQRGQPERGPRRLADPDPDEDHHEVDGVGEGAHAAVHVREHNQSEGGQRQHQRSAHGQPAPRQEQRQHAERDRDQADGVEHP